MPKPPAGATHFTVRKGYYDEKARRMRFNRLHLVEQDGVRGAVVFEVGQLSAAFLRDTYGAGTFRLTWYALGENGAPEPMSGPPSKSIEITRKTKDAPKKTAPKTRLGRMLALHEERHQRELALIRETYEMRLRTEREQFQSMSQLSAEFFRMQMQAVTAAPRASGTDEETVKLREKIARIEAKEEARRELSRMRRPAPVEEDDEEDEEDEADDWGTALVKKALADENVQGFLFDKLGTLFNGAGKLPSGETPPT